MSDEEWKGYAEGVETTDQAEADEWFERAVSLCMREAPCDRATAEDIQRQNLGYFAGYYSRETQLRVEQLYGAVHPIFGPVGGDREPKTVDEAFEMGKRWAELAKERSSSRS